jgi:hypothetical protein
VGCLRRGLIALALGWNLVGWAIVVIVIGDAGVLGEAAIIAESDALVLFFAAIGGVILTLLLALLIWIGRRRHVVERTPARAATDRW